jgi:hypothetical protein
VAKVLCEVVGMSDKRELLDTHPKMRQKQLEILRSKTPKERLQLCFVQSAYLINLSRAELEKRMSPVEARVEWVQIYYGERIAVGYRQALKDKGYL